MFASETFTRVLGFYLFHKRTDTRPEAKWRQVRMCFLPECSSLACAAKHGGHVMSELAWSCCELTGVWIISCAAPGSSSAGGAAAHGSEIISWPLRWRGIKAESQWSVYLTNYRAQLINDTRPLQFLANHRRPSAAVSSLINTEAAVGCAVTSPCVYRVF